MLNHCADSSLLFLPLSLHDGDDGGMDVTDTIGELDKFSVEVRPFRVGVLRLYGSLDVGRHAAVCSFRFL